MTVTEGSLVPLGIWECESFTGKQMTIHCFKADPGVQEPKLGFDHDREVLGWFWMDTPIAKGIEAALHSPRNALLCALGFQKPDQGMVALSIWKKLTRRD